MKNRYFGIVTCALIILASCTSLGESEQRTLDQEALAPTQELSLIAYAVSTWDWGFLGNKRPQAALEINWQEGTLTLTQWTHDPAGRIIQKTLSDGFLYQEDDGSIGVDDLMIYEQAEYHWDGANLDRIVYLYDEYPNRSLVLHTENQQVQGYTYREDTEAQDGTGYIEEGKFNYTNDVLLSATITMAEDAQNIGTANENYEYKDGSLYRIQWNNPDGSVGGSTSFHYDGEGRLGLSYHEEAGYDPKSNIFLYEGDPGLAEEAWGEIITRLAENI